MNCLLVMKIKWSLDINTGAGATVVGDDVIASTGYMKKQPFNRGAAVVASRRVVIN